MPPPPPGQPGQSFGALPPGFARQLSAPPQLGGGGPFAGPPAAAPADAGGGSFPADGEGLAEMAKDPKGSRQLQLELPRWSSAQLKQASEQLELHLFELSKHTFGNYAVSKLATLPPTHPALTRALRGNVVELLQHPQGSRVVQAAIVSGAIVGGATVSGATVTGAIVTGAIVTGATVSASASCTLQPWVL